MHRLLPILLLVMPLHALPAHGEDEAPSRPKALRGLSGEDALAFVKTLAGEEMKGRKTGFEGGDMAEAWAAARMAEYGLHPADAGGTYLEPFTFDTSDVRAPIGLTVAGRKEAFGEGFRDLIYSGSGTVEADIVFVGYGIARPDVGFDEYAGIDVKGKIVMAIRGAPPAHAAAFHEERMIGWKSSTAADRGAAGFVLVQDAAASTGTIQARFHRGSLPAVWAAGAVADRVLAGAGTTLADLRKTIDEKGAQAPIATGVRARLEVNATFKKGALGHNVLGAIKGRDPDLVNEIVMLGAHLDHLGVDPAGRVMNGADDNASGVAVLLHLADRLTANRWKPKRTIVFALFGAEEQGLHGAQALAAQPPFHDQRIVAVLNMDMVGQGEPTVRLSGVGAYPEMHAFLRTALPDGLRDGLELARRTGPYSDHWPFHERGIPAFFLGTKGKHPNYHTHLDDVEAIQPALLERTADVVGHLLLALGGHDKPLAQDRATERYALREAPRFGWHDGAQPLPDDPAALLDRGVGTVLVDLAVPSGAEATAIRTRLVPKEHPTRTWVAKPSDVRAAWRQSRLGVLVRARCAPCMAGDPVAAAKALRAAGYLVLAPFQGAGADALDAATVAKACADAGAVLDCSGLSGERLAAALAARGDAPAIQVIRPLEIKPPSAAAPPGGMVVLVRATQSGGHGPFAGRAGHVIVEEPGADLLRDVTAYGALTSGPWWDPRSRERAALRRWLGGGLETLLGRAR